ncbi:hypothetical protein [Pseudonocardia sp. NPDC049635]|uniref:hypothetical protein n=1 Tax=Pseudonocardia sp. NPDC049635 TaxID=3155506 RepID=UPI0033CDAEE2
MKLDARSLVDLTDDLLVTEQPIPEWLSIAWADALAATPPPPAGEEPDREPR